LARPPETQAGSKSAVWRKGRRTGTWEIPSGLCIRAEYGSRKDHPEAKDAAGEVGPAGSTRSAGKPRTGGSGGAGGVCPRKHWPYSEVGIQ
jgi:hypothetical protein